MSETLAAPVSETPTAPSVDAPGPAVGTTLPVPEAATAPAPAADSPAPETPPTTPPSSLLSEAKSEAPAAEPPPQPEVEKPAVAEAPLPTYEAFALPEGVQLDDKALGDFQGILGQYENRLIADPAQAHAVIQEMGQRMVDLYVAEAQEMQQRATRLQHDVWQRTREGWASEFRTDPDIGDARQDTTLARCGALIERYGSVVGQEKETALRNVFALTGAGDHPEVLRFMNWAAGLAIERARPVAAITPASPIAGTRASRLYRNSIPGAA